MWYKVICMIYEILIVKKCLIFHVENTVLVQFFWNFATHIHAIGIFITCVYNETESPTFSLWKVSYVVNHFCLKLTRTFNQVTINQKNKGDITGCDMHSDNWAINRILPIRYMGSRQWGNLESKINVSSIAGNPWMVCSLSCIGFAFAK